jgi:hypothetical protein
VRNKNFGFKECLQIHLRLLPQLPVVLVQQMLRR